MNRFPPGALAGVAGLGLVAAVLASGRVNANPEGRTRHTPVVAAVDRAAPAVVNITTDALTRRGVGRGSGSGVIVHPDGYVVTNSHVVRGTQRIYVSLCKKAGLPPFPAVLLQDDPSHDLALLRITRSTGGAFPYVRLCPTSEVMIGETAIAIGNPFGLGDTVTVGIVSATGRRAAMPNGHTLRNLLQTDASINLGNSGGALLNLDGSLIGINCSIHPSAQGISFTVPADDVRALLQKNLVQASPSGAGSRTPPAPPRASATTGGIAKAPTRVPTSRDATLRAVGLTLQPSAGAVRIAAVEPDSSADIAGLAVGDLVLEVDDEEVDSVAQIENALGSGYAGRTYFIGIQRGHEPNGRKRAILVYPGS